MSASTLIQWADDTVNPIMGCSAPCELRPTPAQARKLSTGFFIKTFPDANPAEIARMLDEVLDGHNATEIYQLRDRTVEALCGGLGASSGRMGALRKDYKAILDERYICYAHQQTMTRGSDIANPSKRTNPGFPAQFEMLKKFPGRMAEAAMRPDLYGKMRPSKPWLDYLPRVFFVSDMGDALSEEIDFNYLKQEIIDVISSARGRQHIWLWLTKMPTRMAEFAEWLKREHHVNWPDHLVAMTSVTSQKTMVRAEELLKVPARFRGLSVEPISEEVTLPLTGIDWCIVGGQSGPESKPFDVAWITNLNRQCGESGAALFVKQLGAVAVSGADSLELKDEQGGNWNEWPIECRIREMPAGFWKLRARSNLSSPTTGKEKDIKPRQAKSAKPKINPKANADPKATSSTSKLGIIAEPVMVNANPESQSSGNFTPPSILASPDESQSGRAEVPAAALPGSHESASQTGPAAGLETEVEINPQDEQDAEQEIPVNPADGTELLPGLPMNGRPGTDGDAGQLETISGTTKPETEVRIKSCVQRRYNPHIIQQPFTFRISENEDGWGIWDTGAGKWHIAPMVGVTAADLANNLPQVKALRNSSVNIIEEKLPS